MTDDGEEKRDNTQRERERHRNLPKDSVTSEPTRIPRNLGYALTAFPPRPVSWSKTCTILDFFRFAFGGHLELSIGHDFDPWIGFSGHDLFAVEGNLTRYLRSGITVWNSFFDGLALSST